MEKMDNAISSQVFARMFLVFLLLGHTLVVWPGAVEVLSHQVEPFKKKRRCLERRSPSEATNSHHTLFRSSIHPSIHSLTHQSVQPLICYCISPIHHCIAPYSSTTAIFVPTSIAIMSSALFQVLSKHFVIPRLPSRTSHHRRHSDGLAYLRGRQANFSI
ncbi:hypothetical protein SCHPADRAFT_400853 [Schizopora paradoxa]|uniref:Uncharacterized protein n=1 Tax=Schizopora paradoxa TaxID=27342 RepID=A0A0H2RTJ5_9AGAM|nr:hypothetical protein SCHPADRAFT_400853 [Schizopora paradoxa]